jgi:hypothetical protein
MSTLLADTIRKTGGTAGVDIRVKNTSVYESDGGTSVTQNLVQGVLKAWVRIDGTGTVAIDDSFNCGSITDSATGVYFVTRTNNMSSADTYMALEGQFVNSLNTSGIDWSETTTATVRISVFNSTSLTDRDPIGYGIIGDLA